ncbi:hypothetical protein CHELA20_52095 [Hyphomicrobiales bacterium]|nr:hypothetical protein CHELA41_22825 [Hyphomicrobiales bacterium]CAH1680566.1 hypothetical protein CHELA20_52095 [Hyphomicrobiales bacterium]
MAVGKPHVRGTQLMAVPRPVKRARADQGVGRLAAIGAAVHAQRAAYRTGNAAQEGKPVDAGLRRHARHLDVRRGRTCTHMVTRLNHDLAEALAEPHHDAGHAAIAHEEVRSQPDDDERQLARRLRQEQRQIVLIDRGEQHLRRPARAEPRQGRHRRIGLQPAPQARNGPKIPRDVRERRSGRRCHGMAPLSPAFQSSRARPHEGFVPSSRRGEGQGEGIAPNRREAIPLTRSLCERPLPAGERWTLLAATEGASLITINLDPTRPR